MDDTFYLLVLTVDGGDLPDPLDYYNLNVYRSMDEVNEIVNCYIDTVHETVQTDLLSRQIPFDCEHSHRYSRWVWTEEEDPEDDLPVADAVWKIVVSYVTHRIQDPSVAYVKEWTNEDIARYYEALIPFYVYRNFTHRCAKDLGVEKVTITDLFPEVPFVKNTKRVTDGLLGVEYFCQRVFLGENQVLWFAFNK